MAQSSLFAWIDASTLPGACPGGVGLTTALVVLRAGWVIVGSLPTTDGMSATAQAGCLIVLNNAGTVVETISGDLINGPWDMTALDMGTTADLFVTNVLNGTVAGNGGLVDEGTVVRIDLALSPTSMPSVVSMTTIGSGFPERTDPAALVIGPTGVGLAADGTLYVADSLDNRIAAIANAVNRTSTAGIGKTVSVNPHLNDPLGLTVRPSNGDILTVNGNNGLLVITTEAGAPAGTRTAGPQRNTARKWCALRAGHSARRPLLRRRCHQHVEPADDYAAIALQIAEAPGASASPAHPRAKNCRLVVSMLSLESFCFWRSLRHRLLGRSCGAQEGRPR